MKGGVYIAALFLMAFLAAPVHAEKACTEIGCINGLTLRADPSYEWKWGRYDFEFRFDGRAVKCTGALPLKTCDKGPSFKCDDKKVRIGESGCALPAAAHGLGDIWIDGDPKQVSVKMDRNFKTILTRSMVPTYNESRPNGPGCGPVCKGASYNLFTAE